MSESNSSSSSSGLGFCGALTILFIGLKLTGHIDWSWWWVLSPVTFPLGIVAAIALIFLLVFVVVWLFEKVSG